MEHNYLLEQIAKTLERQAQDLKEYLVLLNELMDSESGSLENISPPDPDTP